MTNYEKDIEFLKSLRELVNNEDKEKIDNIIEKYIICKKKRIQTVIDSRRNSLYQKEMTKINSRIIYHTNKRNFEKLEYYKNLKEELKEKRRKGEI